MRAHEFLDELRKNPEKNPKVSINQAIANKMEKEGD